MTKIDVVLDTCGFIDAFEIIQKLSVLTEDRALERCQRARDAIRLGVYFHRHHLGSLTDSNEVFRIFDRRIINPPSPVSREDVSMTYWLTLVFTKFVQGRILTDWTINVVEAPGLVGNRMDAWYREQAKNLAVPLITCDRKCHDLAVADGIEAYCPSTFLRNRRATSVREDLEWFIDRFAKRAGFFAEAFAAESGRPVSEINRLLKDLGDEGYCRIFEDAEYADEKGLSGCPICAP